jgi:hypothetical protein
LQNGEEEYYDFKIGQLNSLRRIDNRKDNNFLSWIFDTDFGNYIRNLGANDYTSGGTSFNGSGNDFPMMVLVILFFQLGYCSRKNFFRKEASQTRVQPNVAIQYSDFEGLNEAMVVFDLGVNLFFWDMQ